MLRTQVDLKPEAKLKWPDKPYKGLNFYSASDRLLFRERENDVHAAAIVLGRPDTKVLLLQGRSGAGKSSFLRAGLLPFLSANPHAFCVPEQVPGAGEPLLIRSTTDPVGRLHGVLRNVLAGSNRAWGVSAEIIANALRALGDQGETNRENLVGPILRCLEEIGKEIRSTLVLTIDQTEEIFSVVERDSGHRRISFFKLIRELCFHELDVKLIVSIRTEFYGAFSDELGLDPITAPRVGLQQFMLHAVRNRNSIIEIIQRPTSTNQVEEAGSPYSHYQFAYAPEVAERIADDILRDFGEFSVLPIMQIVCDGLYHEVVPRARRDGSKAVIKLEDYLRGNGSKGRADAFVDETIRRVLKQCDSPRGETDIQRWKEVLTVLVARQEGGVVATLIADEDKLRSVAKSAKAPGDVARILHEMANERWRLLRVVSPAGGTQEKTQYSLGHDALAPALYNWGQARDRLNKQHAVAIKKIRLVMVTGIAAVAVAAGVAILLVWQSYLLKERSLSTINAFVTSETSPEYRRRLLLLLAGLREATGLWGAVLPDEESRKELQNIILRAPVLGGSGEAMGADSRVERIATLSDDGRVWVQDVRSGSISQIGRIQVPTAVPSMPWMPAAGFIDGLDDPVAYHSGYIFFGKNLSDRISLADLLPSELTNLPNPPWLEISAGRIRITSWSANPPEFRILLLKSSKQGDKSTIAPVEGLKRLSWTSMIWPSFSPFSSVFAHLIPVDRTSTARLLLGSLEGDFSDRQLGYVGAGNGDAERLQGDFVPATTSGTFLRSLAFSPDGQEIAVRSSVETFEVLAAGKSGPEQRGATTLRIPQAMQSAVRRAPFFVGRPALAVTHSSSSWLLAWATDKGLPVMRASAGDTLGMPIIWPPLLSGALDVDGIRYLAFTRDGTRLVAISQRTFRDVVNFRVWDLSETRQHSIRAGSDAQLYADACRAAATDGAPTLSESDLKTWLYSSRSQPCPMER